MILRISGYLLIGIGFIVVLFFRHYTGSLIPYPWLFYVIAALLTGGGIWLLSLSTFRSKEDAMLRQQLADLKQYGLGIKVDPLQCAIKENMFVEELRRDEGEVLALSALELSIPTVSLFKNEQLERVQVNQSVIVYKAVVLGKSLTFVSRALPFDRVTLQFRLEEAKEIYLYVDKSDVSRYYFDLAFLYL